MKSVEEKKYKYEITPLIRRKSLLVRHKDYLINVIRTEKNPYLAEIEKYRSQIVSYFYELVRDYLMSPEIVELIPKLSKPVLKSVKKLNRMYFRFSDLGIATNPNGNYVVSRLYPGHAHPDYYNLYGATSIYFTGEEKEKYIMTLEDLWKKSDVDIFQDLIGKLPFSKLETLKNLICNYLSMNAESYFFVHQYYDYGGYFKNIATWGKLYDTNREWYDIVYENYNHELIKSDTGEDISIEANIKKLEKLVVL